MSIKFVLKRNSQSSPTTNNQIIAEYSFDGNLFTIGSDSANNLVLEKSAFEQAVIVREGEQLMLINSAEGTRLNGDLLRREAIQPISPGDEITISDYILLITDSAQTSDEIKPVDVFTTNENEIVDVYATTKFNINEIADQPGSDSAENAMPQSPIIQDQTPNNSSQESTQQRNFADILDTLRTEDDSFYFTVKDAGQEIRRIALDQAETPIGAASNGALSNAAEDISTICAIARKDWSGILIESQKANTVSVNGEKIVAPRRLRHDDEIILTAFPKFSLVLHEPSSLVALESLLSTRNNSDSRFGNLGANNQALAAGDTVSEERQKESFLERRFFKHFSFVEFTSMIIGTLIGAVVIFLLLEFIFS